MYLRSVSRAQEALGCAGIWSHGRYAAGQGRLAAVSARLRDGFGWAHLQGILWFALRLMRTRFRAAEGAACGG